MDSFAKLKPAEREPYFREAAAHRNSTPTAMEKDFWVCWTLGHLFALQDIPELRFKGGTSLSKAFGLIERFSEDIDISVNRAALGFVGARDVANAGSTSQAKALKKELGAAIVNEVTKNILPKLHEHFQNVLGKNGWALEMSAETEEEMTILFDYPQAVSYQKYLRPQIKIEFGRGDQEPSETRPITPFVGEEFPDAFTPQFVSIPVLDCQRTFWEKVTLLYSENRRPDPTHLKQRMARHWSDVAVMSVNARFDNKNLSIQLLKEVTDFKKTYFGSSWANYDNAKPGTLIIAPSERLQTILRKDYKEMEPEMFYGNILSFDEILARLEALQTRINAL